MKLRKFISLSSLALALGVATPLSQAVMAHHDDHAVLSIDEVELADWEGKWTNEASFDKEDVVQEALKAAAEADGVDFDEYIKNRNERRRCDFGGLAVDGTTITFLEKGGNEEDNTEIAKSTYTVDSMETVEHGGSELAWYIFKADDADAKYQYVALMDVHGEEVLAHFHMRYAENEEDLKKVLEEENWYPTFVSANISPEQVAESFGH